MTSLQLYAQAKSPTPVDRWMLKQVQHEEMENTSFARRNGPKPKSRSKVMPVGVFTFDKVDLPLPMPAFELLFTGDGGFHRFTQFEADQSVDGVTFGEAIHRACSMKMQSACQVGGHANVQGSVRATGQNVDARLLTFRHGQERGEKWMLKQVQHDGMGVR